MKLLEEYKNHRNGDEQHLLNTIEHLLLDKTGWPFKTTQNKRAPVYIWTCLGPSQPPLPLECNTDSPDMDEHLKIYCKSAQKRIALMPEDCLGKVDEKTSDMCKEKQLFWETEAKCKITRPRNMDSVLREECGCSITRVEDTYKMQQNYQVVKIFFNTASFEKVIKSAKTNFVSQLSLIGGTLGLFTGFSLLSGMEILFFIAKVLMSKGKEHMVFKKPSETKKRKIIFKSS